MKEKNMNSRNALKYIHLIALFMLKSLMLYSDSLPYNPSSKESVENYVPNKIFTIRLVGSAYCDFNIVEIFDDRCVYLNFMEYRNCFELTKEHYEKLIVFLKEQKNWEVDTQDPCCKYAGFIEYKSENTILRSCSWLIEYNSCQKFRSAHAHCVDVAHLSYENDLFDLIDEMIKACGSFKIRFNMATLVRDVLVMSNRYGNKTNECIGCLPSFFHSPELRRKE